eukprot:12931219-Prorocentrum_lima.AAC.1
MAQQLPQRVRAVARHARPAASSQQFPCQVTTPRRDQEIQEELSWTALAVKSLSGSHLGPKAGSKARPQRCCQDEAQ